MLIIKNLSLTYPSKAEPTLRNLNLSLEQGMIHGLVGLNGSGKTSLLNAIYGFVNADRNRILYDDRPLTRKDLAYLETENYFYHDMTGREYIKLFPCGRTTFDIEKWTSLFNLPLDETTETYSAGMRRKLALMAVLKLDKKILLLDEPFNGLDLESVYLLDAIIKRMRGTEKTVLLTSHIYESLTSCCDFIHQLDRGVIVRSYGKDEFGVLGEMLRGAVQLRIES